MGKWFWKGCKPNSVCTLASGENHLSEQPYPESVSLSRNLERAAPGFPIWPCTRWGFPCRVACASRGALLPHLFTITAVPQSGTKAVCFLWHCPSETLSTFRPRISQLNKPGLRGIAPFGVRTFLPRPAKRNGSDSPPFQNQGNHNRFPGKSQGRTYSAAASSISRV